MRVSVPALAGLMLLSTFVPAAAGEPGVYIRPHGGLSFPKETNGTFQSPSSPSAAPQPRRMTDIASAAPSATSSIATCAAKSS